MLYTSDLTFKYPNSQSLAFPDISIAEGQHTLLIGPSGCGKTTLLHILAGLRRPTSGSVKLLDKDITKLTTGTLDQYRGEHIGIVFQVPHFVRSLNVMQNLLLAPYLINQKQDQSKAKALLDKLQLKAKSHKKTHELSVGEQQRVAICRALMNDPKIIFADEPTSALDDHHTEQVIKLLKQQADDHGATLVVVTHDQRLKDHFQNSIAL